MDTWTKDRPNLLSSGNIAKIKTELERGLVFCHQYYYKGGRGRDEWAFDRFDDFLDHVSRARPGDKFAVWSVSELLGSNAMLAFARHPPQAREDFLIDPASLLRIEDHLSRKYNEINGVFHCPSVAQPLKADTYDSDYFDDFLEDVRTYSRPGGEIYVFTEDGLYADGNILVEAKYPNERGEVPIGGAY